MNSYLKRLSLVAAALTVAAVLFLPAMLHGDEFNLKTYITVNQPFQVPGAVLQPNVKYVLRRLDANAGTNHVVRILNADETQVISTFFGISDVRLEPADDTILTFYETAPGYPKPVHSWFYPGRTIGLEFIYPKETRAEITAHMHGAEAATVLTAAENSDQNESLSHNQVKNLPRWPRTIRRQPPTRKFSRKNLPNLHQHPLWRTTRLLQLKATTTPLLQRNYRRRPANCRWSDCSELRVSD